MPDDVSITAGSGTTVATDEIGGRHFQRVKPAFGADGTAGDVTVDNPLPVRDDLLVMLSRIVKLLESNAVVDSAQRQRVSLDTVAAGVTLPAVTTVSTLTNAASIAGMDREQFINIAKQTYATSIRSQLSFV